ncbi:hypothetical protein QTP88_015181 [Uroleucon formosanum]
MEPSRTTVDDYVINSKFCDIIQSSRVLSIPLIRCDDQVFNGVIKKENINSQVFNKTIKEEIVDETDYHNDSQLSRKGYELNLYSIILVLMWIIGTKKYMMSKQIIRRLNLYS